LLSKDYFKDFPDKVRRVVNAELNYFFRNSWRFDEIQKEEIEGNLFIKIYEKREQINRAENPAAYVGEICRNHFRDVLRKRELPYDYKKDLTPEEKRKKYEEELKNYWAKNPINKPAPPAPEEYLVVEKEAGPLSPDNRKRQRPQKIRRAIAYRA
jgi:DNA-directed RNA polymerase specialized sigma24 family protein